MTLRHVYFGLKLCNYRQKCRELAAVYHSGMSNSCKIKYSKRIIGHVTCKVRSQLVKAIHQQCFSIIIYVIYLQRSQLNCWNGLYLPQNSIEQSILNYKCQDILKIFYFFCIILYILSSNAKGIATRLKIIGKQ